MAITLDVITRVTEASLKGTSRQIQQSVTQTGKQSGEGFAKGFADGVQANSGDIQKAVDKVADNLGALKVAQQKLNELQAKGASQSQRIAQQEKINKLQRDQNRLLADAGNLYRRHADDLRDMGNGFDVVNRGASGVLNIMSTLTAGTRFGGVTAGVANMASGFTNAGVAVGGMSASMTAAAGIAGGVFVVALAAAAAGAVALTNELYNMGSEWDNTFDNIIVKTGATGDVLEQIKQSVRGIAGDVPASMDVIGDAAAAVAQNLKLVGPEADGMIKSLSRLKSYGIDVDVHSLAMAFRALKIEQDDYQGTLEKFLNFSQQTGVPIDQISASVEANAGALQEFGFTVDEVIALMGKFEAQGIDPDKGLGALNRAFKSLSDAGLEPTKENLQLVLDKVSELTASGKISRANEEINKLFGARGGGLSWLPLVTDGELSLLDLANGGEAARTSIEGMGDATDDLSEQWLMFKEETKAALEPLATEVFKFANEALGSITAWLKESKPEIIGFFTFASTQVVNFAQLIVESIGFAFLQIGLLGEKIPFIGSKFKGLKEAGQNLMTFGNKLGDLQTRIQDLGDRANTAAEFSRDLGENIKLLPDKKTVVLEDTTPEVLEAIDKTKYEVENLPDGQVKITPLTDEATREMQAWIDDQNNVPIEPEVKPDTGGADKFLEQWKKALQGDPIDIPVSTNPFNPGGVLGDVPLPPGMGGPSKMQKFAATRPGPRGNVIPEVAWAGDIAGRYGLKMTSGRAGPGTGRSLDGGYHDTGYAGDFSNGSSPTPKMRAFAELMARNFGPYISELIYNDDAGGVGIHDGKPVNAAQVYGANDHRDHVHVAFKPGAFRGAGMQRFGPQSAGDEQVFSASGGAGMMNYGPEDTSPLPPGTPSPIAGLDPGPVGSTFGYNEYGEPGYYRPDSDSIRSAERNAGKAQERVDKAVERESDLQTKIADLRAQAADTELDKAQLEKDIAEKEKQLRDAQGATQDAREDADDAQRRLAEARQGRFTEARQSKQGGKSGGMGQIGADLADDFGISEGLPGMAQWLTTFMANLAFAPMLGQLSAISAAAPYQGGFGAIGVGGAQSMAANGGALFPQAGLTGAVTPPSVPGIPPTIGPAPLGGGVGTPHLTGAAPGPATPNTSMAPSAGPGGGGFQGLGGLPLAGIQAATAGLDMVAPGMGQAAQTGIQVANRTIGYMGQLAGIGVGGLLETFLPNNSALADPNKSWVGRIAAGFAGARPALPNTAGGDNPAGASAKPQTPEEAAALQSGGGGQSGGPMVKVENINNYTADGGQSVANQIGRMQMAGYSSGGPR